MGCGKDANNVWVGARTERFCIGELSEIGGGDGRSDEIGIVEDARNSTPKNAHAVSLLTDMVRYVPW